MSANDTSKRMLHGSAHLQLLRLQMDHVGIYGLSLYCEDCCIMVLHAPQEPETNLAPDWIFFGVLGHDKKTQKNRGLHCMDLGIISFTIYNVKRETCAMFIFFWLSLDCPPFCATWSLTHHRTPQANSLEMSYDASSKCCKDLQ
jgi:hypothetical protein